MKGALGIESLKGDNGKAYCSSVYLPGAYARTLKGSALGVRHPLVLHFAQPLACQAKGSRFESRVKRQAELFQPVIPSDACRAPA